jgi:predicted KAP-like P-loop ATPase
MKLKAPLVEIPTEDPFRNDLLKRKQSAELLTELVRSTNDPLVLCINAEWGNGKTTFLKMWRKLLINSGFNTLYFNAWENDIAEDALVSLIGELEVGIEELSLEKTKAKKARRHLNKA